MLMSQIFSPTLREIPADAEIESHKLMLRAGLLRRVAAGIYAYLPLGLQVIKKVEAIIREELNAIGGQEVLLPIVQPAELWQETGRWFEYGADMFRLHDRHERDFCLGPTHEEVITALVRAEVRSYRQLPLRLYQIQNKYRDEIRPRFGVMRSREFIMKDMYSFDRDQEGLDESYWAAYQAYARIFERCGAAARPVEADSGAIGGDVTHEFMVVADSGEDTILYCSHCDYAANAERAEGVSQEILSDPEKFASLQEVATPEISTIEQVSAFLNVRPQDCLKTLIYLADGQPLAVLIRGDHTLNELKLKRFLGCELLEPADEEKILEVTGAPVGFAGPVGLKIPLYADYGTAAAINAVVGANKEDHHLIQTNLNRDYEVTAFADLRLITAGDPCPRCAEGALQEARGIEVGHVFKLGTKYSQAMGAGFLDENGREVPFVMGCYGIGVGRTVAAVIERNHDKDGIIWPFSIAPYHVVIVPVSNKDEEQMKAAREIYGRLKEIGVQVVLDDRPERAGVKFKDADLIGFPLRITVGSRSLERGMVELTFRRSKETLDLPREEAAAYIKSLVENGEVS